MNGCVDLVLQGRGSAVPELTEAETRVEDGWCIDDSGGFAEADRSDAAVGAAGPQVVARGAGHTVICREPRIVEQKPAQHDFPVIQFHVLGDGLNRLIGPGHGLCRARTETALVEGLPLLRIESPDAAATPATRKSTAGTMIFCNCFTALLSSRSGTYVVCDARQGARAFVEVAMPFSQRQRERN